MRIIRFPKVLHEGEIYSLSMDQSNTKIATSGKDNCVRVWDVNSFNALNEADEISSEKVHEIRPLHEFVLGDSDIRVTLFSPMEVDSLCVGNVKGDVFLLANINNISDCVKISQDEEHNSVVDLSWSTDGRLISWSCINKKLYIFDRMTQKLSILDNDSIIRSLQFDPTNNYVITLDELKLIKIYQYQYTDVSFQLKMIQKIPKLINKSSLNSVFKKISWSPDGNFISIPNANKGTTSLISIISKVESWKNSYSLVGHNLHCEVIKFNPKIYVVEPRDGRDGVLFNIIATGGSDNALVVWNNTLTKPLFIAHDITEKSITDLCWDKSGLNLYMSSLDGYLHVVKFNENELGVSLSGEEVSKIIANPAHVPPIFPSEEVTLDGKDGLGIQNNQKREAIQEIKEGVTELKEGFQFEKKVSDDTIEESNEIIPEIISSIETTPTSMSRHDSVASTSKKINTPTQSSKKIQTSTTNNISPKITTKNGKKRIQPILISTTSTVTTRNPEIDESPSAQSTPSQLTTAMEFDQPSYAVTKEYYQSLRQKTSIESNKDPNRLAKKRKKDLEPIEFVNVIPLNPTITISTTRIATPKTRLNFTTISSLNKSLSLNVQNGSGNEYKPSRISLMNNRTSKQAWCDFVPKLIHLVTGGDEGAFWALSTIDGNVLVYSDGGRRILPPMVLGVPLSFLESKGNFLMAVSCIGEIWVWDISSRKCLLGGTSANIGALLESGIKLKDDGLSRSENVTFCSVSSTGVPIVTLSSGSGYLYDKDMCCWCTISDSWWAFGSHYWDSSKHSNLTQEAKSSNIIALVEQKTNEEIIRKGRGKVFQKMSKIMLMKEGFENLENSVSLTHLENKILCSIRLKEFKEFKNYFLNYVRRISEMGLKLKLTEICEELLGPQEDEEDGWESEICGYNKRDLLREVILICAKNREVQRVLIHFAQDVGIVDGL